MKTRDDMVREIQELSKEQLVEIVAGVADHLWLDTGTMQMDSDLEWDGADTLQNIASVLEETGVTPEEDSLSSSPGI